MILLNLLVRQIIMIMSKGDRPYIFPRNMQLSRDYHGSAKPRERLASIHRQKFQEEPRKNTSLFNPEHHTYRVSDVLAQSRRLDKDVIQQRNELVTHCTRVSQESPEWWKSTYKHFKRSAVIPSQREGQDEYDVFNRRRETYITIDNSRMESVYKNKSSLKHQWSESSVGKGDSIQLRSFVEGVRQKEKVSGKVGALETRDFSIKKTLVKIGGSRFVDTYSVF